MVQGDRMETRDGSLSHPGRRQRTVPFFIVEEINKKSYNKNSQENGSIR